MNGRIGLRLLLTLLCAGPWLGAPAGAAGDEAPAVPLDRLLELPAGAPVERGLDRRGGVTRAQWEARFRSAREEVARSHSALEKTREEIQEVSGSSEAWAMSAPGLGGGGSSDSTPVDFKLSQTLRRQREDVARADRQLSDLELEANLASVPETWRAIEPEAAGESVAAPAAATEPRPR